MLLVGTSLVTVTYLGFTYYLRSTIRLTLATRDRDAAILATPLLDDTRELAVAMGKRFAPEFHDRFMRIMIDGKTIYISGRPASGAFDPSHLKPETRQGSWLRKAGPLWILAQTFNLGDRTLNIESGLLDDDMEDAKSRLLRTLLIALPAFLGVAAAGGYWLVQRALTPVTRMINAAEALTFNSPHKRLPLAGTDDELDELVKTMNRMLERLDHAYQHANRFSADAAHELRTPLAIMRGELEFIAVRGDLAAEVGTAAASALEETVRLSQLVENLMNLAVIDATGGKRAHRPVDLRALAVETIEQMQLLAVEKNVALAATPGPAVVVLGDHDRLKQALVNLIDNAIKYTRDGKVVVDILSQDEVAQLSVTDSGIGISPDHQESVFERFFRVDPERGARGAGLGLAIVKSICAAHGGSIGVNSAIGRGTTFTIDLPLAPMSTP
jgi:signal transduction histidine kinase